MISQTSKKGLKAKVRNGPSVTVYSVSDIYLLFCVKYNICCVELVINEDVKAAIMFSTSKE